MALLVPPESPASFLRSDSWRQILQLRREESYEFPLLTVQLVSWVFQCPIAALFSFEHIWTQTTALLAKPFPVSI